MILLDSQKYPKLTEPLKSVGINCLFAQAVIEQKMDGEIYVDHVEQPATFYVKHRYGMALLFGKTDNDSFNHRLTDYLLNSDGSRNTGEWLQAFPEQWNDKLNELMGEKIQGFSEITPKTSPENYQDSIRSTRVNFKFNSGKYTSVKLNETSDFKLVQTDTHLFDQVMGTVIPRCFWRNGSEFAKNAIGFTLMHGKEPVSTAFTPFVHEPQMELGIETKKEFQGKGLALYTCSALIDYCLRTNYEPVWACRLENTASVQLAQKLGFEPLLAVPYYQLPFQADQTAQNKMEAVPV